MGSSLRIGKILGIPIGINYSWIFVFLLYIFLISEQFGVAYPAWPLPQRWTIAVLTTLLLFVSVLAHELAHSLVAIRRHIPVHGITFFIFGGVSHLGHEAQRPLTEFLVAVVGPLVSFLLALVCGITWYFSRELDNSMSAVVFTLFAINLSLGAFNLLPGFPLDGGRVLRSAVWGLTGSYWLGTRVAARSGQGLGLLLLLGGVALAVWMQQFQLIWFSAIGGFLLLVATASYRQEQVRESLKSYRVADVMSTDWYSLPGETALASPLVARGLAGKDDFLGVLMGRQLVGVITRRVLAQVPAVNRPYITLNQAMIPLALLPGLSPEEAVYDVYHSMERQNAENLDRLVVRVNGAPLGFVTREQIGRLTGRRWRSRR